MFAANRCLPPSTRSVFAQQVSKLTKESGLSFTTWNWRHV